MPAAVADRAERPAPAGTDGDPREHGELERTRGGPQFAVDPHLDRAVARARDGNRHGVTGRRERGLKGRGGVAIGWQLDLGRREQARVDRTVAAGKEHACKPCDVGSLYSRPPDKRLVLGSGERHVEQPEVLPECLVVGEGLAHLCGRRRGPGLATGDVDRATSGSRVLEHDVARGGEAPAP